jgi:hypothetical protein
MMNGVFGKEEFMADLSKYLNWEPVTGEPQVVGNRIIRMQAQAISLITPFGGFVWNRPTAVLVEKDGITDEVPIIDPTRYALISIGVMGVVGMLLAKLIVGLRR